MENITAENQILKNQLMAINSQAAYSYYYNPYVGYSSGASAGGWQQATSHDQQGANVGTWRPATSYNPQGTSAGGWQHATPYHPQRSRATYSPITPMQPLFASEDTPVVNERQAQLRQTAPGTSARRHTTPTRRSMPNLPQVSEDLLQPGTNVEEMMRNIMSEEMRTLEAQMQQRFTSQIHKATTSTAGFDDLARGVRETPLTSRITSTITPKFGSISFPRFDGMSDPHDHLLQYKHVVQSTNIPTDMLDDMMCKLFAQSLKGAALRWLCNFPAESIDSFDELSLEFMRSYSVHIQSGKTTKDLWGVIQGPHESLCAYIKRFSKAISEISGLDDGTVREALKKGLRHRNERVERDLARTRDELSKAREERAKTFRRERSRPQRRTEHRVERTTRRDQKRPLSPPKYALGISLSELIAHLKRQDFVTWPKKLPENPARDTTKYCEFHRDHGHHTIDCRALRAEVVELLKKGHLREFLTDKGRETYGLGSESKERRVVQQIEDTPSPPPVWKTIGVIF
ncbi:hypothetical protein TIFTF001_043528 [Ficus carica]|uniref:Retrotransposon gag domain-containing protein n=1 Tax=Ficus carica TaxID=3494 RepID=A0AA87YUQ5_FICCA|nr:hypothetical protein TIFTF001_043521 [Ficus carica]GMN22481.1 hypothetical protein TIFTF001_043522 [Ficus carica]GMN22502.1 hypothetical protein TIFTF001_043527 [Ficus carica]GMN22512.1 hypothetical protein TIFTF001_043528 [Ficus carica]